MMRQKKIISVMAHTPIAESIIPKRHLLECSMTEQNTRRFPPPWSVEQIPGGYKVLDANLSSGSFLQKLDHARAKDPTLSAPPLRAHPLPTSRHRVRHRRLGRFVLKP